MLDLRRHIKDADAQDIKTSTISRRSKTTSLHLRPHFYTALLVKTRNIQAQRFICTKILSMTFSSGLLLAAASLLCAAQIATAIPHTPNNLARALIKRDQVTFEDCGDDDDKKRKKAGQAWSEAANLASLTMIGKLDDGTEFKDTNA